MDAVHRYEGYVAQALGDGIFALFGAPIAHEDHPQRALYAALRMQEGMRRYSDEVRLKGGAPLLMRVGINTGEVIREEGDYFGMAVVLALQDTTPLSQEGAEGSSTSLKVP